MTAIETDKREAEIAHYFSMNLPTLYAELYHTQFPGIGVSGEGDDDAPNKGKKLFKEIKGQVIAVICPKKTEILAECEKDTTLLIVTIADLLAAASLGFPLLIISMIVTKIGVKQLCEGE